MDVMDWTNIFFYQVSKAMEPEMYHCAEPYKCELCAKSFLTLARLRKHCLDDHDLAKYFEVVKDKVTNFQRIIEPQYNIVDL